MISLSLVAKLVVAANCIVDPTQGIPGSYPDIDSALVNSCSAPYSVIDVQCPSTGCAFGPLTLVGVEGLEIHSNAGPATIAGFGDPYGVYIEKSVNISIDGSFTLHGEYGVDVLDSAGVSLGTQKSTDYLMVEPARVGMRVRGRETTMRADNVAFNTGSLGWEIDEATVYATGIALAGFDQAGQLTGGLATCPGKGGAHVYIQSSELSRLSYVRENVSGFTLFGSSELSIDHTVFDSNLRQVTSPRSILFDALEASNLTLRNVAIYDNDEWPTPVGKEHPCTLTHCAQSNNRLIEHETCGKITIVASTIADQETDGLVNVEPIGSGEMDLDHVFFTRITGKTFSMSSFYTANGCPPMTSEGSTFWNDGASTGLPAGADFYPPACTPTGTVSGDLTVGTNRAPAFAFPAIPAPPSDVYLLKSFEPISPYALPPYLYDVGNWSVDSGILNDNDPLDVGFHSPQ